MHFLEWIEQTGFSTWVRESGTLWSYPTILFLHTVGLGFLVGPSTAICMRICGFAPAVSLWPMERFYPVMWAGFWINVGSGLAMLMADASTKLINPVFYVKLVFVVVAVWIMHLLRQNVFRDQTLHGMVSVPLKSRVMAGALLICWVGAIAAGRLMAYLGPVSGAPKLNNTF
jgi:hypothetical protein